MKIFSKVLLGIAGALLAAFAVKGVIEFTSGNTYLPKSAILAINAVIFILPAAILTVVALILIRVCKKRGGKDNVRK